MASILSAENREAMIADLTDQGFPPLPNEEPIDTAKRVFESTSKKLNFPRANKLFVTRIREHNRTEEVSKAMDDINDIFVEIAKISMTPEERTELDNEFKLISEGKMPLAKYHKLDRNNEDHKLLLILRESREEVNRLTQACIKDYTPENLQRLNDYTFPDEMKDIWKKFPEDSVFRVDLSSFLDRKV
ncbi:hypothetical protein K504DRAFT_293523 [Pleomassaria siparia CBS 279.74]|uniref:Uncharacterized protein n=1 Tax=Pleomassaria siparia CBS 279.74 TaxID=1314801 RepID=A0A6G1K973_9PLEO|nr:hypothetical protein K504DRAFT_293523 [Pleomassaria siparia CBS 279.74]